MKDESTPGQWFVRKREQDCIAIDCWVSAPDCLGFAYDAEFLGDDEYRDTPDDENSGIKRKLADCELIVKAVTAFRATTPAVQVASPAAGGHVDERRATLTGLHALCESISGIERRVGPLGSHARGYTHKITAALRHLDALAIPPATPAVQPVARGAIQMWNDRIKAAHPKSDPEYWPDELKAKYMEAEILELRAAFCVDPHVAEPKEKS